MNSTNQSNQPSMRDVPVGTEKESTTHELASELLVNISALEFQVDRLQCALHVTGGLGNPATVSPNSLHEKVSRAVVRTDQLLNVVNSINQRLGQSGSEQGSTLGDLCRQNSQAAIGGTFKNQNFPETLKQRSENGTDTWQR